MSDAQKPEPRADAVPRAQLRADGASRPQPPGGAPQPRAARPAPREPFKRRPISPRSPLEGRQLWRIGDWGGASEAIGHRWEALGARALRAEVLDRQRRGPDGNSYVPSVALILAEAPDLAQAVHRHGKTHADALLLGYADGHVVLEPVDFKWTLETAEPRQVGAEVLESLLDEPPALLREALDRALAELGAADGETRVQDGIFLAPDHSDNRGQVQPRGPLPAELVVLSRIEAREFFPPLPGWDVAQALARQDGAYIDRLETAERYYRLGAGVLGALRKLRAGIFGDDLPELDGPAELVAFKRSRNLRQTGEIIAALDRALIARAELLDRLREVERQCYPFARYRADLAARGVVQEPTERRRWERLYGEVIKALGRTVRAEGRALLAQGRTEQEALKELAARAATFTSQARAILAGRLANP